METKIVGVGEKRHCPWCGAEFTSEYPLQVCCDDTCQELWAPGTTMPLSEE
jgi:predicted nucleic acid-binding Zn ribbon protein